MIILQDILSQEIVQRLGWTLLHFIWQAAVVALLLAILLRLLRKSTANLRYIFACLALGLIILLPVITIQFVPVSAPRQPINITPAPVSTVLPVVEMPAPETIVIAKPSEPESAIVVPSVPLKQRAITKLEPALPYIVSGWLIGVFGLSIWNLGGWTQLQRLKRRMVKQVDSTLLNKLKVLSQKLKIKQTVRLMESALVQIPTVVGWLKPVILLPASALTGLNAEQLEAIIAHELAHVKRFDYLINILQTIVEILGFYHPAVWWVSYKIRAERENCCDDMAVSISGDRLSYAGALASMEEIRTGHGKLAVAAGGGNLFRRICRLLDKDSADNTGLSWVPAATVILLIIALAIPTTLALTNKSESLLTEPEAELQVEDDIIEALQDEESLEDNTPPAPVPAKSIVLPDENRAVIKANCLVVEVPIDLTIDNETLKEAENILGNKVSFSNSKIDVIMNATIEAMNVTKEKSTENKRVTQEEHKAFIEMLTSKGYLKILMNPTLEVMDGEKAEIKSIQNNLQNSIRITPHVLSDDNIILEITAELRSQDSHLYEESAPVSSRRLSTRQVRFSPGETLIVGGLMENPPFPGDNINNTRQQTKEILFIITPTIMTPPVHSSPPANIKIEVKKVLSAQKLKKLGLAVAMYADDHDENLPESIQELRPYIRDRQDFDWLRSNVEYFDKEKTAQRNAHFIPIAYDSKLPEKADGTNVLFLDFSVRFLDTKEFEKLDLKKAEIFIDARFLSVSEDFLQSVSLDIDSRGKVQRNVREKLEALKSLDFSKREGIILDDLDVILLLNAVQADKDSKVLANPQVLCREGKTAQIEALNNAYYFIKGYTEPNRPSEKPQPKLDRIEKGITLSLRPNLTPDNNIYMQFEFEIITVPGFEEKMYKGKYPYKQPTVHSISQGTQYTAKNGQTMLFGGHKIADHQDGQTEQKDLLVLITARTVGSSEQDKPAQAKRPAPVEQTSPTTKVVTPPTIAKSRTERQKENEQKPSQVQAKEDFELPEITQRMESAKKLSRLSKALLIYANDHDDKYPNSLTQLREYLNEEDFHWALQTVEYLASGNTVADRPDTVIAYDIKLLIKEKGTNVLYNDCHVSFGKVEELKKLGINIIGNQFLIETRFLAVTEDFIQNINHNADSPDEAKELLELKPKLLAAIDGPNKLSFIPPERNINLLLKAVRAHKESKILAAPHVLTRDGTTAEIKVMNNETYYIVGYTEPNSPSEKPQPILEKAEEGISLSLRPKLTENKNIDIQFESTISQFLDFEERKFNGKGPYKPPKVRRSTQSSRYVAKDGQTLLLGGNKISDRQDDQTEQKDLLVLITAHTIGFSEQDKLAQAKRPALVEPPSTTTKVVTPPATAQSRRVKPDDSELKKTKPATVFTMPDKSVEPNQPMVTMNFKNVEMKFIIEKLAEWTGKIIIPTAEVMSQKITTYGPKKVQKSQAVEMIYHALRLIGYIPEETDNVIFLKPIAYVKAGEVPKISEDYPLSMVENKDQVVQKSFKLKHYNPSQMGKIIQPLVGKYGHVSADEGTGSLLVIDTAKNLMRIEKIIEQYDVSKADETVTEIFEIRYGDPVEIVELLKKLINGRPENGAIIETVKEPIVLIPQPVYKWIIAKGSVEDINQIGQWIKKLDISKSTRGLDPIDKAVHEQLDMIVDLSDLAPGMSFGEVVEKLENSVEPPLQIQPIWKDLLENAEVEQATPAGMDPLPHIKLRKALEILLTSVSSTGLPKLTYVVDEGVILIGTVGTLPPKLEGIRSSRNELRKTKEHQKQPLQVQENINKLLDELRKSQEYQQPLQQAQEKIDKLLDESEELMTPLEQIQKQLDELIKQQQEALQVTEPNLPPAPKANFISNTFIDCTLIDALQYIAAAGKVTIIPDETVSGTVTRTLKDVTVETALDIVLEGTPYVWKKTPYYYLVASKVEPSEITERMESAKKLSDLGKALLIYAKDHGDKYPVSLHHLPVYLNVEDYRWVLSNVEYLAHGKTLADRPDTVIAYDKTLLTKGKGTNVLYNDCHVGFVKAQELKKLDISREIMIETQLWSVSEDYLKAVGLDANFENFSDDWKGHLAATYPAGPNGKPYGLMIDDLHLTFLLRAIQSHDDSNALVAPRILCREGKTAEIGIMTERYQYITGYNEPNRPSGEPQPKKDKVDIGTHIWLTPKLTENSRNVNLDFKLEISQLKGIIEGKYGEKYPTYKPIIDVISMNMTCTIPAGKSMLIGGLKINEHITKKPDTPGLKDLPLIGAVFSDKDKTNEEKMLLVLIKPVTNPRQKATGREDSEEYIQFLAEQLEKKLKRHANKN